ncbi:MAG: RsmE family RNA methyltransferase, partial [Sandaracinaceae bacterium]|nr:RsmE family RNA methyltransferase [Sandaracinaceae bacterium]
MNLLLIEASEAVESEGKLCVTLEDERARHLREVLRVVPGQFVRAGIINGPRGHAEVLSCTQGKVSLRLECSEPPLPPPPLEVIVALPRPRVLAQVVQSAVELGVAAIHLVGTERVERAYFGSHLLRDDALRHLLLKALAQAGDTRLPQLSIHRSLSAWLKHFKPTPQTLYVLAEREAPASFLDVLGCSSQGQAMV